MTDRLQQYASVPPRGIRRPAPGPKWLATDIYTLSHLQPPSAPNHSILKSTLENSNNQDLPPIYSSRAFAKFLALQAKAIDAKHCLEVGTLGAFASIWLASVNEELSITTLEFDPKHAEVARENISNAGMAGRITVIEGPAISTLPAVLADIEANEMRKFDMVYVDADKENNRNYFDAAVRGCRKGAVIIVDNVVQGGLIASEDQATDKHEHVLGAKTVIENAGKDERVSATVLQTVGEGSHDGFLYAVVL
ncbi:O-methyltransferase-like protein family 3 [Aureobasidium subglaciale]|nr:O-methyltransferase-like protein family 3 [Aureobasidium subglaciale]